MTAFDFVGYAAALCSTVSFMPQVVRTWRTRSARDLSLGMLALMMGGAVLWLIYGVSRGDGPMTYCNIMVLGLCGILVYFKFRHG